jgi:hypothetical protein
MTRPLRLTGLLFTVASVASVAALAACGGADQPGPVTPAGAQGSKVEAQKVANLDYFDVATVAPTPPSLARRPDRDALLGVELAARPVLLECLVDPKNRGPEKATHVVVDATTTDTGVEHHITGTNVTASGAACLENALKAWTKGLPTGPGAPVESHLEIDHLAGVNPAVVLGVNDASDVAAAVRLALPGWGECFAEWKNAPPRLLRANLKAARAKDASPAVLLASVAFEPTADPAAGKVAACLEGKLKTLAIKPPQGESVTVPYVFRLVHSGIDGALPDAPPDLQLVELDLQRARRLSEVAIAIGERAQVLASYDDRVKRYKAKARPEVTLAELSDECTALLAAGDKLLVAAERQTATEDATHLFAESHKAKDPAWTEAEATAAKSLSESQRELATYRTLRKKDESACPKLGR